MVTLSAKNLVFFFSTEPQATSWKKLDPVQFKDTAYPTNKFVSASTKLAVERENMMHLHCNNCNDNISDPYMTLNCT